MSRSQAAASESAGTVAPARPACRIEEQDVRFSPRLFSLFDFWLQGYLRRHFNGVRFSFSQQTLDDLRRVTAPRGLVVYSNHPSWWDPILFFVVGGRVFPARAGFGPMDAEQLERYRFFKKLGVFGVEPGTRKGALSFLRASEQVLELDGALLWVTAQGDFVDARARPVQLQPGLGHLAARVSDAASRQVVFLPCAVEIVHWTERLPEALLHFGDVIRVSGAQRHDAGDCTQQLATGLERAQDQLAAAAQRRDPSQWISVLEGKRGVGGAFDRWRRLRAALTGRRFDVAHLHSARGGSPLSAGDETRGGE